ncbi:hypothetical protein UlMin_013689 [Ulmus minor]
MKQALISSFLVLFFLYHTTKILALSPAQAPSKPTLPSQSLAQSPDQPLVQAPPGKARRKSEPTNVTEILDKAGGFSIFIRLLRNTQIITQIENDLNATNPLTILAPTNGGFSELKAGTLNTLTNEQKVQLVEFHILPTFITLQNFQTLDNHVRTQASNTKDYPLNIITDNNSVNISTGVVNTTIYGTVYADNQLAIYRVDKVLLPLAIFSPKKISPTPAPAPAPLKPKKESSTSSSSSSSSSSPSSSKPASSKPSSTSFSTPSSSVDAVADESDGVKPTINGMVMSFGVIVAIAAVSALA